MTMDEHELRELLDAAQLPGPLPDGLEDRLWADTADVYDRLAGGADHAADVHTIELVPEPDAKVIRPRRRWPLLVGAAAAAVAALIVVGPWSTSDEPETTDVAQVARWVDEFRSEHAALVRSVQEGVDLRDQTARVGLASQLPYLDSIVEGVDRAIASIGDVPADDTALAEAARRYERTLDDWATAAGVLREDLTVLQDEFTFEPEALVGRLDELRDLERTALVDACQELASAAMGSAGVDDSWLQCGLLTPENE